MSLDTVYDYTPRYFDTSRSWDSWRRLNPFIEDLATRRAPDLGRPHGKPIDMLHHGEFGLHTSDFQGNPDWGIDIKRAETGIQDHWRESVDRSGSGRTDILDRSGEGPQSLQRQFNKALTQGDVDWNYYNRNEQYGQLGALAAERASAPGLFAQDWAEFDRVQQIRYINELIESGSEPEAGQYSWDEILQHYTEPEGPTWEEQLEEIQNQVNLDLDAEWDERAAGLQQSFSDQFGLLTDQFGQLQGGLSDTNLRLSGQSDQFSEQLRRVQQGLSDQLAAALAGWDTERAAWNQQEADWTQQYTQQQRQAEAQLATEKEEFQNQLESIRNIYGVQTEEQRTAWEDQSAQQRSEFAAQLEQSQLLNEEERTQLAQQLEQYQTLSTEERETLASQIAENQQLTEQQRDDFSQQLEQYDMLSSEERAALSQQLEQYQIAGSEERAALAEQLQEFERLNVERAEEWRQRFAQSQEQQRIADAIQRRDLEASLAEFGNQYQRDWAVGSQALQADYQRLIHQASTDAERARLEQARQFERLQMDQAAAYNQRDQELAAQDLSLIHI